MIKRFILYRLTLLFFLGCTQEEAWDSGSAIDHPNVLSAEKKLELVDSHDQAFLALNEKIRDPFILAAPDGYFYLTGTTAGSHWGETIGIHLWRSSDLVNWEALGFVWDLYKNGESENSWHFSQPIKNPH